ncbi:hypothetical protein [Hymenobacter lapidiphilus]|uniref:hypothetical protein n=1 Tax=Hymenobacter sp. CCM 8763 TaxID=2303334 RepID=UPI00167C6DBA|nr:hypothetical protein [Hymenobacter sp. CCM 8763]
MNWLEQMLPPALVRALGWTLLHSLWQGAVVALALAGLLLLLRRHSAQVRYRTAAAALITLLLLCGLTFGRHYYQTPPRRPGYHCGNAGGRNGSRARCCRSCGPGVPIRWPRARTRLAGLVARVFRCQPAATGYRVADGAAGDDAALVG